MRILRFVSSFLTLSPLLLGGVINCIVSGNLYDTGRSDGSANAFFTPSNGSLSQTAASCLGSGAHFDWYQIVTLDPMPPKNASVPYIDPQPGGNASAPGGWRDALPWYYDESLPGTGIGCVQGGVDTCQFYDPIAWQVTSPCITYLSGQPCPLFNYVPTSDFLAYSDTPQNPQASIRLSFQTRLVVVSADQTQWAYVGGFSWDWANPGNPLIGVASNFQVLSGSTLVNPPSARQGGGPPPPFFGEPPPHSSLGFPPNPLLQAIPEPSSLALIALGTVPFLWGYRSRRNRRPM